MTRRQRTAMVALASEAVVLATDAAILAVLALVLAWRRARARALPAGRPT